MIQEISEKCNGCGASVVFEPEKQGLHCVHCTAVTVIESPVAPRNPLALITEKKAPAWDDVTVFECTGCGAQEVLHGSNMVQTCAFCGASNINQQNTSAGQKPDAIVPFKIGKQTALERLKLWAKRKFFAPNRFKKNIDPKEMDGVYNPVFTFDSATVTQFRGVLYRIVTHSNGRSTWTSTQRKSIGGTWNSRFSEIVITVCDTINQTNFSKLGNFSTPGARVFRNPYIYGFAAGQYKRDGVASWVEARRTMEALIQRQILAQYPGWSVETFNANTQFTDPTYRYMLLPVYIGHLKYKEKRYDFYMNGENGVTTGRTPVSGLKVAGLVGGIVLGLAGVLVPIFLWQCGVF